MFRRRRPLMRAAVVGGTAYVAGKKIQEGRDADAQAADEEVVAAEADGLSDGDIAQLQELAKLKDQGVLTQEEFDTQKQKILGT